ncbi:MAG: prolipoprotein diacylglyceryl transferase [Bacteroidetes bacterium]|nr:prolipoprotein diacylglyceryl transferase [Bacteroidota bacterium]
MMRLVVPVYVHTIFEVAAFVTGFRYYLYLRKKSIDPVKETNRIWIIVGATAGALLGSRILGALEDPSWMAHPGWKNIFIAFNNKTIVGGLFGGTLAVELTKIILGEKKRSGDLFVFPILLALIIGRIGCLLTALNDHTAGISTTLPWGIDYGDGISRHPLPFYEIIFLSVTFFVLRKINEKYTLANGSLFQLMMVAYFIFRFFNEYLKDDHLYPWKLSTIQTACVLGLLYYAKVFIRPGHLLKQYA